MKKLIPVLLLLLTLLPLTVKAQKIQDPPSSTFGLNEEDAAAVSAIRKRMAQIRKHRPTVALVLSGGGAKGAATVGALKVLERYDLPIDMVLGTSIGGLIGGLYALGYDADYMDSLFRTTNWDLALSDKVDRKYLPYSRIRNKEKYLLSFPFYYKADDYKNYLEGEMPFAAGRSRELRLGAQEEDMSTLARNNLLGSLPSGFVFGQNVNHILTSKTVGYSDSTDFFKLPIPYACVATDMVSGKAKVWHSGSVNMAMRSTMSIPGLFAPVRTRGMVLVDGGMRNNFPVNIAKRMGADIVIGIDLSERSLTSDEIQNLGDLLMASIDLFSNDAFALNQQLLDVHIHPDMTGYGMLSFNAQAVDSMYWRGYKAAEAAAPQLEALKKRLGNSGRKLNAPPAIDINAVPVHIGEVEVVGVSRADANYILEGMQVKPGTIANQQMIEEDIARIFGKGAYDYVNYELRGKEEPFKLRISCKRGPMHKLGFGARVDSEEYVSLLFNVGLNTNAMQGYSLDVTARLSMHPYLDLLYAHNGRTFATFNVRANISYLNHYDFVMKDNTPLGMSVMQTNQEIFFSNMHWSQWDVKLGLKNQFYRVFQIMSPSGDIRSLTSENYPGVFIDSRIESLDNGYFPTRGISAGLRGDLIYAGMVPENGYKALGILAGDITVPFSIERFTLIAQLNARVIFSGNGGAPPLFRNAIGGDIRGRFLEQQIPFIGVGSMALMSDKLALGRVEARYRIGNNHYISIIGNSSMDFSEFSKIKESSFYSGFGMGYAYNSVAGPLKFQVFWSSLTMTPGAYLSVGFNF